MKVPLSLLIITATCVFITETDAIRKLPPSKLPATIEVQENAKASSGQSEQATIHNKISVSHEF